MARVIIIDCADVIVTDQVWGRYIDAVDGRPMGRNFNAFWDAIEGGGPGWPGQNVELHFTNTTRLVRLRGGEAFLQELKDIADRASRVKIAIS